MKVKHFVDTAGLGLHNTEAVASILGLKSVHHTGEILHEWREELSSEEMEMLQDYHNRTEIPDEEDPFPELGLDLNQTGLKSPLQLYDITTVTELHMVKGNTLYKHCRKALNKKKSNERKDSVEAMTENTRGLHSSLENVLQTAIKQKDW